MSDNSVFTGPFKSLVELLPDDDFTSESTGEALPPELVSTAALRRMLDTGTTDEREAVDVRETKMPDDTNQRT
ncbi:MAG: hypothetical protein WD078_04320 [Woeseia sp.]